MISRPRHYSPVERQGVNAVERIILDYHWIFREHPTSDFGIDAEIEICEDGIPSGRLVKVQIKAGTSWFRERDSYGIVFRDSPEHFEYWISHSLPVILTLYHPETGKVWWVHIEQSRVQDTGRGRKIIIPEQQVLSPLSAPLLKAVAGMHSREVRESMTAGAPAPVEPPALVRIIQEAQVSVDIAVPRLTEYLGFLLIAAAERIPVRVIVSAVDKASVRALITANRRGPGVACRLLKGLHLKQILVDQHIAIYGSSIDPLAGGQEIMVLVQNESLVRSISLAFEQAWSLSVAVDSETF